MRHPQKRAFTLVEVMIVVVIIGICAAIVAPQLVDHKRSSSLTDLVNLVQQTASQARSLALQTRHGAVLEVSGADGKIWINVLSGPQCWDSISKTCVQTAGHAVVPELDLNVEPYLSAEAAMCGVQVQAISGADTETPSCDDVSLSATSDFALCYAGNGELYVRASQDGDTACSAGTATAERSAWSRVCASVGDEGGLNGAVIRFNRFDGGSGSCGGGDGGTDDGVMDVTRAVYLPIGGAPYSKVEI